LVPLIVIAAIIKLTSRGPVIYMSNRIGINNTTFKMAKFRTMRIDTPQVATHLLENPEIWVTSVGKILRKYSLDELPQLINILKGDLSFVGPRPALFNQKDLIDLRTQCGVHAITPGLTGWAQINGRDELSIPEKVEFDTYYLEHRSFLLDLKIILLTFVKSIRADNISH
jgi:O-antigen biosynthesis protein WbqP